MSRTYAANPTPIPESTLNELFFEAYDRDPGAVVFQRISSPGVLEDIRFPEVIETVRAVASALDARGVARGDRIAILSENRPEWALVDYGSLAAGVIPVPIYPTTTPEQIAYQLDDAGVGLVFLSDEEQGARIAEAARSLGRDLPTVVFDAAAAEGTAGATTWADFLEEGRRAPSIPDVAALRARAMEPGPQDIATILYTSGTTGQPKGVVLTHDNIASNVRAACMVFDIGPDDNTISFLPLSHILQRMCDYLFLWTGCRIAYPRDLKTLAEDLRTVRPTVAVSVPRIYEKIYNGIMAAHGPKKLLVDWAADVAREAGDRRLAGEPLPGWLALRYRIADRIVYRKVRAAVGGRIRFFVSGGGPLAPELARFFHAIGLTILEGYGLTETSPVTNVNTVEDFRIGTVGKPVASTEIRIAEDGEIFVRGRQVMKGYYERPEDTAAVLDEEGWLATGDVGMLDDDGFLSITDRKKDIIVTAGGKNIAPQPIENRLKTHPLVEQAVIVGDRRRYPSLLVVPDFPALEAWARQQGIAFEDREALVRHPQVVAHLERETLGSLGNLASYERPKKMALLSEELTVENGFLTPTLKVKRNVVQERLRDVIDRLYEHEPVDTTDHPWT